MSQSNDCQCCKALWIEFELQQTLTCTSQKANAKVIARWQGENPEVNDVVEVYNLAASSDYVFSGFSGYKGMACYDDVLDRFRIVVLEKRKKDVVFDIRLEEDYIQALTTECKIEYCEEPEWVDKIPVEECPPSSGSGG